MEIPTDNATDKTIVYVELNVLKYDIIYIATGSSKQTVSWV